MEKRKKRSNTPNKRKSSKKKTNSSRNQIFLTLFILNTFFIIFSFFSNTGFLGEFIKSIFYNILGNTHFVFLVLLEIIYIFTLLNLIKKKNTPKVIMSLILFFNYTAIVDLSINSSSNLSIKLTFAKSLAEAHKGSGFAGAILGFIYSNLIGKVGLYIFTFVVFMSLILSFLNITFGEFFQIIKTAIITIYTKISIKYKQYKENKLQKQQELEISKKDEIIEDDILANDEIEIKNNELLDEIVIDSYNDIPENDVVIEEANINTDEVEIKNDVSEANLLDSFDLFPDDGNKQFKKEENKPIKSENEVDAKISIASVKGNKEKKEFHYKIPSLSLLKNSANKESESESTLRARAKKIETTLKSFGVGAKVVKINKGPTVTCFELQPEMGVKVNKIVNLSDDLSLALASPDIRIEAPIPGKSVIGIEVANTLKENVSLREILSSNEYKNTQSKLPMALGKTISGEVIVSSIDKMPHMLIAGATGSGKSVCINTIILSILYKSSPEDVKMILIDPKVVELSIYNNIPHLAIPVVTDAKKASAALNWAVKEMERRYSLFSDNHVRDIKGYHEKQKIKDLEKLPYLVIIIDELSDLMMVSANEVETYIARIAQMARACGIHLIVATQRPSVDVITGTIKANIPSRISFQVSSQIDSRTILDSSGAEALLGKGDMLFSPSGSSKPIRIQGCFISDSEVEKVVTSIKNQLDEVLYDEEMIKDIENQATKAEVLDDDVDELFYDAVKIILEENSASISLLQRKMKIGYARAGRIIDEMESRSIISKQEGSKSRQVLVGFDYLDNIKGEK